MDGMDGPGSETLDVRQRQLRYEDLTEQIRSRIDGLIGAYADLELSLEDQQPTINDDYYRLDQLDTSLRNCITQLLPLITQYEQAVAEWNRWDDYMQVTTTDTPWTRQVYRVRMQFFKDDSRLPPLPEKVQQLIQEYNATIVAVRTCRDALNAHAQAQAALHAARSSRTSNSGSNSRASTPAPAAAHSAAAGPLAAQSPRATPTSAATHSVAAENRGAFSSASTSASKRTTTADTLLQRAFQHATISTREDSTPRINAFQPVQPPASDPPAATQTQRASPRPSTAPPVTEAPVRRPILKQTKQQVRIVTELDHGDRTPPHQGDERGRREFGDFFNRQPDTAFREADLPQAGLFSYADASGNVHAPSRPAVMERNPAKSGFWAPYNASPPPSADDFTAPAASPQSRSDAPTTSAQQTSAPTTGPTPHSGNGTAGHDLVPPSYVPPQPVSIAASNAPDHTRTTTYHQASDDRGLNGFTPPLPTPPISAQPAPSTAPTDDKVDPESTNSFYRAATCNFRAPIASAPPLILKELPFEPFDGDIRKFPSFRDRFLETMHSYRDIGPRHRLQYLLQCLKGPPRSLVEAYALRDENYWIVLELLEDRYGDKNRIAKLLIKDVLGHRLPSNSTAELQQFHDNMFRAVQTLKLVDSDIDPHVNLYGDVVLGKLPAEVRKEIIQQPGFTTPAPVSATLKGLRKYLNTMAQVNEAGYNDVIVAMKGGAAQGSNPQARQRQPAAQSGPGHNQYTFPAVEAEDPECTVAAPRAARKDRSVQCAFCGRPHFSGRCNLYRTIEQRLKRIRQLNRCLLCLRAGHWSDVCPSRVNGVSCQHCSNRIPHHVSLCRGYMNRRPGRQLNAPVNQPSPHGGSEAPRSRPTNAVNGQGRRDEPAANHVRFSSAQYSPPDNSNDNRRKQSGKKKKNKGTSSSGSGGTPRPTTASAAESTTQQDVQAWDSSGLLPGHSSLLQTDRCPNTAESTQHTDDIARRQYEDELSWLVALRACEEVSSPESIGHGSEPNFEDFGSEFDEPTEYPESSGYAVCSSTPPDTQAVILECVKAIAVNPRNGASREVIVFFDSGSTASYVSTELARALDLPRHAKRQLQINTFAATTPTTLEGFSTSLVLRSTRGRSIALDATAADNIVRSVRTAFVTNEELPQLRKNDCALISTRETPDLLIGQDLVHLFDRRHEKRLPNGCYVVHTVLGPMVGGAGQVITTVPRDAVQSHVADTGRMESTLCFPGSGAPMDIFDRSTSNLARNAQTASSMTGTLPITTSSGPAHSASPDTISSQKSAGTHSVPADGHSPGEPFSTYLCGLVDKTDAELLGDFSYLENAGIGTAEMTPDDQAAAEMLKTMHQRESDGRYKVPLLFRTATGAPPSNDELPTNAPLAKGRAISTRNSLIKAPEKLKNYDGIIRDYEARGFIGKAPRFTPYPKHCLSHHPVFKETSTTTATRPVFDASAKLPGRSCLNDWVFRGPVLLPVVPAILLRSRFPVIIIVCDIGKAFLQMSVLDSHRDCLRFYWFKDPFAEPDEANTIEYRFNRVPFGLKSSPYLLAGVIKMHLEQEGTPLALEMLKNCYVDNVLLMADNVNEALQKYRDSKATFAKIQMPLREYASNNSQFNNAIDPADRAELEKLRELGIRWDVTADYWDIPLMPKPGSMPTHSVGSDTAAAATGLTEVPAHSAGTTGPKPSKKAKRKRGKKTNDGRLTKRSMLRFVAQIYDPLGLAQAATLLAKLVIQEVWKLELDWDDDVPEPLALLWAEAIKDFDKTIIRIPRRIARSKVSSVEIHVFTDGSSQAYGFTAYLRVKENDGSYSTNLVYSRAKVKPIKDGEKYTIPRMELLGVLVGARAAKFLYQEVSVDITAVYLWSDSTIVLHQVADTEKIKEVFVENRLKEIRQIRDQLEIQFRHVPTDDNPADIVSRGIAAAELQHCSKWWFGASFLAYDERHWPTQPTSLGEGTRSVPSPSGGLELYGSDTFAALYTEVFTPPELVTNRRFRPRKKKNPLDNITKPLPPTTVSAYVMDALGQATHSVARPTKLPSISMLPSAIEEKHPVWSRQVRITYYVVRFTAACLRRLREKTRQRSPDQAPRPFTSALGFDVTEHFKSTKPNLRDLQLTETIMLRKTQLRHPPSQADRRNLGIFEYQGLLYVKGRLGNMKLRPTALTPLYLPREAKETELIIMDYHRNNCHSGVTASLANIRMRYWFTRGRRTIQAAIIKNCFPCRREVLHPYASPPWPQLPASRVTRARPFLCTGLDFFGPCYLRTPQADGHFQVQKYYVAIFVCMTYRCVHLELCADLSTQEFLHALRRFGSRREYPERILSDNGQSFLTAREVIQQVHQATAPSRPHIRRNPVRKVVSARLSARRTPAHSASGLPSTTPPPLDSQRTPGSAHSANPGAARAATVPLLTPEEEQFIDFCQRHKIEWQTITELSPWKGGVYERLIGLIKHCLRRSIGRTKPTVVEFSSLLAEAEHTANSRPLSYIADSETDFFLVRPLDFLIPLLRDEALQTPLDPPVDAEADPNDPDFIAPGQNQLHGKIIKDLKRARLQADLFWTQFRDGFLAELRSRGVTSKRQQFGEPEIHPGDLVLVWEPNVPRCFWRFALVLEVLPCDDGAIRSARVRFSKTHQEHARSLAHLYPIGNLPRVPAQCHTTSCADVYLSSVISDNPVTMGNGQSVFSAPTLYDDDMHVPDAPLPSTANTELRHSATLAHSAGAAESAAIAQTTTEGTPSPTPESSTPEAEPTISDSTTRTDNLQLPNQTDLQERANITATHALVDAGPRADQDDQGKKTVHTTTTRLGARGAFQNRASAALAHSAGAAAPSTSTTESRTQPATEQRSTDVWSKIASDNANTAKNRQAQTAGTAFRGRGAFKTVARTIKDPSRTVAAPQEPTPPTATTPAVATTEADPWSTPDNDPWGAATPIQPTPSDGATAQTQAPTAISAHSARMAARAQAAQAAPTRSVGAAARPTGNAARPTAQPSNIDLLPPAPTLDLTSLPPRPSLATIKREVLQFFSFEEGRAGPQGQRLAKVDDQTLASRPVRKAQDVGFWIQHQNRDHGTSHWDPIKVCNGRDENRSHFHQSIRVHRIIIQSTWNEYRFLAARQDLLYLLEKLVNLRIMCFCQMILIEYAVRLRGDHDRMGSIVQFIYDILRTTDFEGDVPRIINRYYRVMTRGLDHQKSLPTEEDLRNATIRWLCYCHKALLYFLTHLSGDICWNVEWLQNKDLDRDFRRAISGNILMKARTVFQDIRRTVYQQYILRRIRSLELGDPAYKWARLDHVLKAKEIGETLNINTTTVGKTVIFAAREICESAFVKTMKKDDILLNWMPSSNRVDVLDYVRRFFPGSMTERVIFWFGQSYLLNGNEDYGQLLAELSYHYTTHFGQIDQYVILPAYDRTHRQVWTSEVLCLYLMRGRVVPHAQVILHPYDLRLWQMDQPAAERGDDLEPWSNRHQSEKGHIYKFGAVEARKGNLRAYHRLDLWTWYMEDHQGELPPQELHQHCSLPNFRPRGEALATQLANSEQQATAATAAAHSATAAAQLVTAIASPIAAAAPPVTAAASAVPASSPSTATVNQRPVADIVTEVLNCVLSGPVLQTIVVDATQQAVRQVSSELDAKLARIEELLRRRAAQQPTAMAEHRPQDFGGSA